MPSSISTARLNLILTIGYALLGAAGLMLGSPPSYASPIFPAAGLALAAVLVYGLRALPGAMLGNFLLTVAFSWLEEGVNDTSLAAATLCAVGAAARACAGYWLIKHWQGKSWRSMEREQEALLFVVYGGLVSGLVAASICVPGLVLLRNIAPNEGLYNWWTWYVGDALGIMLFAPLSLCFLMGNDKLWRDRRRRIVLPTLLVLSIFSAIFFATAQEEERSESARLHAVGDKIATSISDRLIRHHEILTSLRNFVEVTPSLSFDQFQQFTRYGLRENNDIFAIGLTDLVNAQRRSDYEREMSALSLSKSKFVITEHDHQGQLVMAGARPQHLAIRFMVPLVIHYPSLGYDYFSEPEHRQAIQSAMSSRSLAMTAPVLQLDGTGKRMVVNAFYPVYRDDDTKNPSWRDASGFVSEGIYLDAMIEGATKNMVDRDLIFQLRDVTDASKTSILYQSNKRNDEFAKFSTSEVAWTKTFAAANRQWELSLVPGGLYGPQAQSWGAWATGAAGLFFAGLLQILMLGMTGRTAIAQRNNQELQSALERSLLADKVMINSSEAIAVTDKNGAVTLINPAFTTITGYKLEEIQGVNLRMLSSDRQGQEFFEELWLEVTTFRQWKGEIWNRRKNGDLFPAWMTISSVAVQGGSVSHYVTAFSDITEYKNANEKIEFLAFHDVLTGLPNRTLTADLLSKAINSAKQHGKAVAVLCLGLDKFKHVNDTHGHATGDALLKQVVQRLTSFLSKADLLGRLSGDEFVLILNGIEDPGHVALICEKIRANIAEPVNLENVQLEISVSIGVALYPEHGAEQSALMRHSDMALLNAKQDGRNTFSFFHEQMNYKITHFVETRDALRQALQREEFELHYQPQIDLESGRVLGVEALIRWSRPYHGLVAPVNFIPTAEESGLIAPMGTWVLREACRQAAKWTHTPWAHLVVAVNVSSVQFRRGNLEEDVLAALRDSGLAPERLELELTESILLEDADSVLATVNRLKAHGIQLSIDDFGTGYSSLSYLQRFNVEKLKIDRCFVTNIVHDQGNRKLVQAIIQMAKSLNLRTIAEGVEDIEMEEQLKILGCDEVQGYFYAKPLPIAELERWLSTLVET